MSEPTYVERLRAIRDRIGEELQHMSWQEWEAQAKQKVRQDPKLACLIESAQGAADLGAHVSHPMP